MEERRLTVEDFLSWVPFEAEYFTNKDKEANMNAFYLAVKPLIMADAVVAEDGLFNHREGGLIEEVTSHNLRFNQWDKEVFVFAHIGYSVRGEKYKTMKLDLCSKAMQAILKQFKLREIRNLMDIDNLFTYACLRINEEIKPLLPPLPVVEESEEVEDIEVTENVTDTATEVENENTEVDDTEASSEVYTEESKDAEEVKTENEDESNDKEDAN